MAQEPEQPQTDETPDPQFPYGEMLPQEPPRLESPTPLSYLSPEFYQQQPVPPTQQPEAQSGYSLPTPGPYIPPVSQPSYDYAVPGVPPQQPYGAGSNYGHGGMQQSYASNRYGDVQTFQPPPAEPLPLGEAIRQLPGQYWRAITRPASMTFANEMGQAGWGIIWIQIVFYTIIIAVLSILSNILLPTRALTAADTGTLTPATAAILQKFQGIITLVSVYGQVVFIPLVLFVGTGILFLLAKAFGGVGRFTQQLYCTLLFLVPLGIIVNVVLLLLSFIPIAGSLLALLLALANLTYEGILMGFMLMPVHRLSGGRAAGAVLLLFGTGVLLICVLGFILAIVLAASIQPQ